MNKQEKLIVAALFLVLIGWMVHQNREAGKRAEERRSSATNEVAVAESAGLSPDVNPELSVGDSDAVDAETVDVEPQPAPEPETGLSETTVELLTENCRITLTSKGGGIRGSALLEYPKSLDSEPGETVELAFPDDPALSLQGIPGFGKRADFSLRAAPDSRGAELTATREDGLRLERKLVFTNGYRLAITDRFVNASETEIEIPTHRVMLGAMRSDDDAGDDAALAVDLRVDGDRKPTYPQMNKAALAKLFGGTAGGGCSKSSVPAAAPLKAEAKTEGAVAWAAVRTRFFVQVLTPGQAAAGALVRAKRAKEATGSFRLSEVDAALEVESVRLPPGESLERTYDYYAGPRKMASLRTLGQGQAHIMRFGMWRIFCEWLLDILNFLYAIIPNYGVAIILLTGLVRLVMYPVTKRGAEGMKRMQALQPKLKELQALYKDDPQKQQRETMRLYSENKVNPLSSCLPMFIQLPVFIALFTVLRGAVELRFAPFLWVADLSSPENLLLEQLGFGINLLPFLMSGTMALQSYLTPKTGDPSQQRMMMILMPGMMLVMFYGFPAALGLYWTTSQILAICGLLWQRRKNARSAEISTNGVEVIPPPKETRQMRRARER